MDAIAVLWLLTTIYLAVLVIVLAVSITLVAWYARGIADSLTKVAAGLEAVRGHTEPLGEKVALANKGLGAIAASLSSARDHLVATDSALATVVPLGEDRREVA